MRYVVFDRALPLSESATAGTDHHGMTMAERLAALLITDLEERPGTVPAIALVRAAMALAGRHDAARQSA